MFGATNERSTRVSLSTSIVWSSAKRFPPLYASTACPTMYCGNFSRSSAWATEVIALGYFSMAASKHKCAFVPSIAAGVLGGSGTVAQRATDPGHESQRFEPDALYFACALS